MLSALMLPLLRPIALCVQWSGGKDALLDATLVSPLQRAMVSGAAAKDGFALRQAVNRSASLGGRLLPLAIVLETSK